MNPLASVVTKLWHGSSTESCLSAPVTDTDSVSVTVSSHERHASFHFKLKNLVESFFYSTLTSFQNQRKFIRHLSLGWSIVVLFSIYMYLIRKFFHCHFNYQPHFNYYSIKASQMSIPSYKTRHLLEEQRRVLFDCCLNWVQEIYNVIVFCRQAIKTNQGSFHKALASFLGWIVVSIIHKIDGEMKNSQRSLNCILSAEV